MVSAEDARFYVHHGFDWRQVEIDAAGDLEGGRVRHAGAGGGAGVGKRRILSTSGNALLAVAG